MVRVFVIAECGVNWLPEGMPKAQKMVKAASKAGADFVKFQIYRADQVAGHARYGDLVTTLVGADEIDQITRMAMAAGANPLFTPMFPEAVDWLTEAPMPPSAIKVRHADATNEDLLRKVDATAKEVFVSFDPAKVADPDGAAAALEARFGTKGYIMYCCGKYPATPHDVRWPWLGYAAIRGFSCHVPRADVPVTAMAYAFGAKPKMRHFAIEVHFRLDGDDGCIEKDWSVTSCELAAMIERVRELERVF